ncbi:MAG TPA: universal stress protein [Streptosporangiaceae bacterium]|nr:universal stress protein [Streptosporangiaceae bacterium]
MAETVNGIVAGYDGSPGGAEALSWASREARARRVPLVVCHSWAPAYPLSATAADVFGLVRRSGAEVLAQGVRHAQALTGSSADVRQVLDGAPAAVALCEHGATADMVVVGSRGHGRLGGLLLGSVSSQVAAHAPGRVVVVRGHWRPAAGYVPGAVVAGADGSAASQAALMFAFEEAALREARLLAVCALADTPGSFGGGHRMQEDFEQQIARCEKDHPEVAVLRQVKSGPPRAALLEAAAEGQMLVLGSRGRGGVKGMMLGSVSQAMLHHAPCPVGIVHPPARDH